MKIMFSKPGLPVAGVVVVGVLQDRRLTPSAKQLDGKMKGGLIRAIKASRFKGAKDQTLTLMAPAHTRLGRVLVVGLGKAQEIDDLAMQCIGGRIYSALADKGCGAVSVAVDDIDGATMSAGEMAVQLAYGAKLNSYKFSKYLTVESGNEKSGIKTLGILCTGAAKSRSAFAQINNIADGVFFTRDLVSEPSNVIYPETLAAEARSLAQLGVKVEVLSEARMKRLGMNALLAVGQGSAMTSKLVVMEWHGLGVGKNRGKKAHKAAPIAIVGKGVTFDSGGISIKPSNGMEDMKWDMAGSAVVIGLIKALAGRKAKVDVVGVIGLVENMPSSTAQRPGDIVTSMSGQTIEVINTDAEGRLVLADALWYCKERFKPRLMIDLATLTGAIIVCLGHERAGLFSNNDTLAERISEAGDKVAEKVWRFPMGDEYDKMLKSDLADMRNIGANRGAGSITAAQFLKRFVGKTPWAHIDIAGMAWSSKAGPITPKGGTGYGVRLLERLIADNYESE